MECLSERSKHWRSMLPALISYHLVSSGEENCHGRGREFESRRPRHIS
jgi:N-glycosylase/DNA lyase